jgi:hypothetical protein
MALVNRLNWSFIEADSGLEIHLAKYLVTGVAGFIGRSVAAALLARGETVRGMDSFITLKRASLVGLEAMEFVEGNLTVRMPAPKLVMGSKSCSTRQLWARFLCRCPIPLAPMHIA